MLNDIDLEDFDAQEKLFRPEIAAFEKGPARLLKDSNPQRYNQEKYFRIKELVENKEKVAQAISRHYTGERKITLVVVFDNVDKRSRDVQLAIFEAAQWFKELTRALVIVNMRDTTFEAHRDEPPLDAFINAVNFLGKQPDGSIAADIVDPHGTQFSDALPKLRGLARYAEAHPKLFRRIESVAMVSSKMRAIDLTNARVRKAIAESQDARSLFESQLAHEY